MKVLIITPCDLPVPAVMGGAVQTLVESLVRVNEENQEMELTIISSYYEEASEKAALEYPKTIFISIKPNTYYKTFDTGIDTLKSIVTHRDKRKSNDYLKKMDIIFKIRKILHNEIYDKVVIQNSGFLLQVFQDKTLEEKYKGRIYYHLHNVIPKNANRKVLDQCHFLLISDYLRKNTEDFLRKSIEGRYSIVKNGIPTNNFSDQLSQEEKNELRKKLDIPLDKIIIIFAGRIIPQKGIDKLLDAVQKFTEKRVMVLVVGSAFFAKQVKSEFEGKIFSMSEGLKDNVRFTGYVPYKEIWKYYAMADIAVLPSMWDEPAGLTVVEAITSGLPTITTRSGGIPEYVDSDSVIFLERNDSIVDNISNSISIILNDLSAWKDQARIASKFACENYSEEAFFRRFLNAIGKY